jgi:Flp pilus assembly protein TadG
MTEFAIALPILMALLVGILEVGRMIFTYTAVTNASREAVRYASAVGLDDGGNAKYQYCDGIRNMARRSAYFLTLADGDIAISYDHGPGTGSFDTCSGSVDTGVVVNSGPDLDRVLVTVTATYSPMVNLIPIGSRTITSSSARTILGIIDMTTGQSVVPTSGASNPPTATSPSGGPTATVAANTPTVTVTSDTPTATDPSGPVITFTPLPSSTPTLTPTVTPTFTQTFTPTTTFTPTMTFTPTATSTPVPGCGSITTGSISITGGNNMMSLTITNPHDAITVLNVQVTWNSATGGPASKPLILKSASLEGVFWTGSDSTGNLTITPSTTVTIPGNNITTPIIFAFDKNYQNANGSESIVINLSTPGCESFPIHRP